MNDGGNRREGLLCELCGAEIKRETKSSQEIHMCRQCLVPQRIRKLTCTTNQQRMMAGGGIGQGSHRGLPN